jgi:dolichyl-diphosphooligosaccharide--protein glycosyltransferase
MDSATAEWWRRHGWTIGLLLAAFGIAFGIRTIWEYPVIQQYGALYTYAGGSDSYYHSRVMTYIIQTHTNLIFDPMLKFPVGAINPREPLFDWMNAVLGILFAPFFGGNAVNAGAWFLDLQSPLWAALAVFPIYLIGREASGRRTGLIAALVYPFFSASINSSTFGYADYLSFYTFFLLVVFYSFLRTLKAIGHRRWVESYRHPRQFLPAVRGFLRTERTTVKWSVFTGVALGAFGLAWQGYTYAIVVIAFTVLVAMLIERIRRVDSFGLYLSTWIIGLVAFPMLAPYYLVQGELWLFLLLPIILFFGTLALLLPFLLMRDVPWVFSVPVFVAVVGVTLLGFRLLEPALFASAITGNGYFTKTLIYSTVAEAQAPSIDALIVGYGVVTFFLAFAGLALFGYHLARQRFKRYLIAIMIFAIMSIYLPISAAKFFLVASPAFALLSAEGIHRLLDIGGYPQLRRAVASLTDRSGNLSAFRKSFKARHVLVLALAVGILLPNIWIAIDAGIPSNTKEAAALQINHTIPSWLKLNVSAPASSYLGAAGSGLDTPNQYDSAAYSWLATQDTNVPEPQRPAFVSWWDYGFQAIDQGQHPSVADNFQNGIDPAGQFLLAQNESLAIAILAVALLQGEELLHHNPTLPTALNSILARDGVNVTELHALLTNSAADYSVVVRNPQTYLPVNPSTITDDNAMYLATSYYLAGHLSLARVAQVYDDLQAYTGWTIRYAMTDSRLFPFSGSDTGIFYAPADLTGRVLSAEGTPTSFFNVTILGSDGNTYPLGPLPAGIGAVQYNIAYSAPFYNSMIYRIYIGYNGTEVGQSGGIPGLSGAAAGDPIEPGWMLQHFEVEYQTAFVCPGVKNASAGSGCMVATNRASANAIANRTGGTADLSSVSYFEGGESVLAYYPGVTLNGRLASPAGQPIPGVRVTVYDGWGIPHMTNVTSANGAFSLVLPPGNDTLRFSYGTLNPLTQSDTTVIRSVQYPISSAFGFDTSPPSIVQTFTVRNGTVSGLTYWNATGNATYDPTSDPVVHGAQVVLTDTVGGSTLSATTDPSGTFLLPSVPPGIYNVTVGFNGQTYGAGSANVSSGGQTSLSLPLSPGKVSGRVLASGSAYSGATVTLTSASGEGTFDTTNATGGFNFTGLIPGTYGISAAGPEPGIRSALLQVSLPYAGDTATVNLTLSVSGTAEVAVEAGGAAVPNATITFTPVPWLANTSLSPAGSLMAAATNTTFATTSSLGVSAVTLPVGAYTVAATVRVASVLYSALGTVDVTGQGATPTLLLNLTPARTVSVSVSGVAQAQNRTAVLAYATGGPEVIGWAGANGTAVFELPDGSYSFLAVGGALTAGATPTAGLAVANITGPRTLSIPVGASVGVRLTVGTPVAGGGLFPAANATMVLSAGPGGPVLHATAGAAGVVGFLLPSGFLGAAGGYCLSASAFGFASATTCGLSLSELGNLSTFDLAVNPVPVSLQVLGLPAKTSVTVNVTGETVGAANLTLIGGPSFSFTLPPGTYGVGASAEIGHGTTVYLPVSVLSTTIPLGATYSNLTLVVVPEINASGKLTVPNGVAASTVTIALASPLLNLTVNGTAYRTSFRATPGTYTATVTATKDQAAYANLYRVTLYPNGTIEPALVLDQAGVSATITLTGSGTQLYVHTTVSLVTGSGLTIDEPAATGEVSAIVPVGTYQVLANATAFTSGPNGTYLTDWTTGPSANCTLTPAAHACSVPMVGTPVVVVVQGTLVSAGGTVPIPGTIRLVGPYPSTNVTVVAAPSGTFTAALLPGVYSLYAASTVGPPLATFGRLTALPSAPVNVAIPLGATWTDAVLLTVQSSNGVSASSANITVKDIFGDSTTFPDISVGTVLDLALPPGTYVLSASGLGTRNAIAGVARASTTVALTSGNAVTDLALEVPVVATVSATLAGPGTVTVAAGRQVAFDFTVHNSGNVPVEVSPVGSPSGWGFSFSFTNVTLSPGANATGQVRITVPNGTAVDHPPVSIVLDHPDGSQAGAVSPAPVVNVLPYYGLAVGTSSGSPPEVGPAHALLPFYVVNTGNTAETVRFSVVDAARLASYGWGAAFVTGASATSPGSYRLNAGQNLSVSLNLTATTSVVLSPGSATVQVTVTDAKGSLTSTVILAVPRPAVGTASGTFEVTGPSVQTGPSPVPDWFVPLVSFVPALLLVLGVVTYRWWRTRRWTRR